MTIEKQKEIFGIIPKKAKHLPELNAIDKKIQENEAELAKLKIQLDDPKTWKPEMIQLPKGQSATVENIKADTDKIKTDIEKIKSMDIKDLKKELFPHSKKMRWLRRALHLWPLAAYPLFVSWAVMILPALTVSLYAAPVAIIQREKPNEQTYRNSVISDKQTTQDITRKQKYQKQFLQKELKYTGYVSEAKKASLQQKQATVTRQAKSTQFSTQSYKRKYQRSTLSAQSKQTGQTSQKYKRQSGRASTYSVKNMKHKVDRSLQRNISPKNRFRSQIKELVIDKVGRDGDGNLNLIGLLIALFILVPILLKLIIIITIVAIVITVITVVISIFMFIASLFVIKTEDMALEEAYRYVTDLADTANVKLHLLNEQEISQELNNLLPAVRREGEINKQNPNLENKVEQARKNAKSMRNSSVQENSHQVR